MPSLYRCHTVSVSVGFAQRHKSSLRNFGVLTASLPAHKTHCWSISELPISCVLATHRIAMSCIGKSPSEETNSMASGILWRQRTLRCFWLMSPKISSSWCGVMFLYLSSRSRTSCADRYVSSRITCSAPLRSTRSCITELWLH